MKGREKTGIRRRPGASPMRRWPLALFMLTLLAAGFWFLNMVVEPGPATVPRATGPEPSADPTDRNVNGVVPRDPDAVVAEQVEANQAAAYQLQVGQLSGPINERPEFVSRIEWQVLNQIAQQSADSERELTRLVNHLRFSKQLEIWKNKSDSPQRDALAQQLLRDIPVRVYSLDLSPQRAQQLQVDLLVSLYDDLQVRRQRIAEEAERIGISFDVKHTPSGTPNADS